MINSWQKLQQWPAGCPDGIMVEPLMPAHSQASEQGAGDRNRQPVYKYIRYPDTDHALKRRCGRDPRTLFHRYANSTTAL